MTSFARLAPTALATREPAILIMPSFCVATSFATELATPSVTDERTLRTYGHLTAFNI